jgi:hypothetical protein
VLPLATAAAGSMAAVYAIGVAAAVAQVMLVRRHMAG